MHRLAHGMGMPTHCTMLYNHVENYEERVDHLLRLRELQDDTGGFLAFIPLPFHPENTVFERRGWAHTTGHDDLKMQAVSRLMLDNIPNIKAYWIMISTPLAQVALHFGANDIQGTVVEETIAHAGGATTPTEEKIADLVRVISRGRPHPRAARHALQRRPALRRARPPPRDRVTHPSASAASRSSTPTRSSGRSARHLPEGEAVEVTGVPTALNRMLRAGEIDVANCSSIEYAAAPERYVLLPSMCVGSDGAVDSVQLVTDLPLEQRAHRRRHLAVGDVRDARAGCCCRRPRSSPRTRPPTRAC